MIYTIVLVALLSSFLTLPVLFNYVSGIPYEQYILAPSSRTLYPISVHGTNGTVSNSISLARSLTGSCVFDGVSSATFNYQKNIAGVVTLTIGTISSSDQFIGITFSESSLWISSKYSDATADGGRDETLWFQPTSSGGYTVSREHERGSFRHLTLVHNSTGTLEVTHVETHFTPMPHYAEDNLRNYTGYFHSNDELLN
ncbi:hypothetical protein AOQ84DRAFT_45542 [Glonium stellatum]|uniref:Uncharacterized protein n=1 Tax=Glonium stellatum TaxID=574774 RepID=A0A8E2JSP4_9PEZI|nr:hypothetical protein AOQ84DRAFT_45542 [Glonium stellatum]